MLPQICEPLEVLTWDAEGEMLLGEQGNTIYSMRLSLLEGGLPAFLRTQETRSVWSSRVPPL